MSLRRIGCLALLSVLGPAFGHGASVTPLGALPGGSGSATATDVANAGTAAVGNSQGANGFEAFLWTPLISMQGLGDLPGGGFSSFATGCNALGTQVVGRGTPSTTRGFVWSAGSGMTQIPGIFGGTVTYSACSGISDDGSVIVGSTNSLAFGIRATVWRNGGLGIVQPDIPTGNDFSEALAVSGSGLYACGWSATNVGNDAAMWGPTNNLIPLLDLPGGPTDARAQGVSDDGSVAVGRGWDANSNAAVRWVNGGPAQLLAPNNITSPGFNSEAYDCSANGGVIVGRATYPQGGAFIWTLATGMLDLKQLLASQGVNMAAWPIFSDAMGVSADGTTIVGNGIFGSVITGYLAKVDLAQLPGAIRCTVALNDLAASQFLQPIQVEVWQGGDVVESFSSELDALHRVSVITSRRGMIRIALKGSHWLRKASEEFDYSGATMALDFGLTNGDVDGDNEVGPGDFGILSGGFGTAPGDIGWNAMADLDEDGEVGPSDFGILSTNFGQSGD